MKYSCKIVNSSQSLSEFPVHQQVKVSNKAQAVLAEFNDLKVVSNAEGISLLSSQGALVWKRPFKIEGRANTLYVSQDRLLLITYTNNYHAWGFLGPAFLIDSNNGECVAKLEGQSGAALENGDFIIGLEGYGIFTTWRYDRQGEMIQKWDSYGWYIVDKDDDIRVLEQDRLSPTKSRLVRLQSNGEIEKGPLIKDSQIGQPLVLKDQSLIYIDCGVLKVVDTGLKIQQEIFLMTIDQEDIWRFCSSIQFAGDQIKVEIYERTKASPIHYKRYAWQVELISVSAN